MIGKLLECPEFSPLTTEEMQLMLLASENFFCFYLLLLCNNDFGLDIMNVELGVEPEFLGLEYLPASVVGEYFKEAIEFLREAVMMYDEFYFSTQTTYS